MKQHMVLATFSEAPKPVHGHPINKVEQIYNWADAREVRQFAIKANEHLQRGAGFTVTTTTLSIR